MLVRVDAEAKARELFLRWLGRPDVMASLQVDFSALAQSTWSADGSHLLAAGLSPSGRKHFDGRADSPPKPLTRSPRAALSRSGIATRPSEEVLSTNLSVLSIQSTTHTRTPPTRTLPIPRFFFGAGRPLKLPTAEDLSEQLKDLFDLHGHSVALADFASVTRACGLPVYWTGAFFHKCSKGGEGVTLDRLLHVWKRMLSSCQTEAAQFVYLCSADSSSRTANELVAENLKPLVQYVLHFHPGLQFLVNMTEFHAKYEETIIARIFFSVNRSWSGRISVAEVARSDLLQVLRNLEDEEEMNQATGYFAYADFYVVYSNFLRLDVDRDGYISRPELSAYGHEGLLSVVLDRIYKGTVFTNVQSLTDALSFTDFVRFMLAEEGKDHPTAMEFWFRVLDLDGDGMLSLYELETFYAEQRQRLRNLDVAALDFRDCLCLVMDMVSPRNTSFITLSDLKRSRQSTDFLNTFVCTLKYLETERKEPSPSNRDEGCNRQPTEWNKFVQASYDAMDNDDYSDEEDEL